MKDSDLIEAIKPVAAAFTSLGVSYYIGGSVASSAYGAARTTLDVDMASELKHHHVRRLVELLEATYYIDEDMILDAIKFHSSFNLIHLETMIKVDVFIPGENPYKKAIFQRKIKDTLDGKLDSPEFYLVSPEDIILLKLDWYRMGGEASVLQWRDVLGVLKVQKNSLDKEYLSKWASELKLADLLEQAYVDADINY